MPYILHRARAVECSASRNHRYPRHGTPDATAALLDDSHRHGDVSRCFGILHVQSRTSSRNTSRLPSRKFPHCHSIIPAPGLAAHDASSRSQHCFGRCASISARSIIGCCLRIFPVSTIFRQAVFVSQTRKGAMSGFVQDHGPHGRTVRCLGGYRAFTPASLPPPIEWSVPLAAALSRAYLSARRLAGEGSRFPNPHLFIRSFMRRKGDSRRRILRHSPIPT